jgi:hypothetical protein
LFVSGKGGMSNNSTMTPKSCAGLAEEGAALQVSVAPVKQRVAGRERDAG